MNVLIILGHPNENSFNHAIANTCKDRLIEKGCSVTFHDLNKKINNLITKLKANG